MVFRMPHRTGSARPAWVFTASQNAQSTVLHGRSRGAGQGAPSTHAEPMLETADRGDQTAWDREHLSKDGHSEREVNAQRPISPGSR